MMDSPIHTRWNGMVSTPGSTYIRPMLATAVAAQAASTSRSGRIRRNSRSDRRTRASGRNKTVPDVADGLHTIGVVQFGAQPAHADVDDVATRVEGQAPHVGQDLGPTARPVDVLHEVL